jgi:hypothetical protein
MAEETQRSSLKHQPAQVPEALKRLSQGGMPGFPGTVDLLLLNVATSLVEHNKSILRRQNIPSGGTRCHERQL